MGQSMDKTTIETTLIKSPKSTKIENMNGEQVSYKVSLLTQSGEGTETKSEVRRFVVPQDCSTSMVYLKEKLRSLFGNQLSKGLKITWKDEDGDDVSIESDEELVIALHEMKGPLYKLSVVACNQEPLKTTHHHDHVQETPVGAEVHPGVTCDACEGPVHGHRYKCLKCPDYDLCAKCEAKGFHPGHNMMRIATPETIWPRHFFNRLNKMQTRASKINEAKNEAKNGDTNEEENNSGNADATGWGRGRGHFRGSRGNCQRGAGSVPPFWMPPSNSQWGDLMNIGQAVRAALDPFGVDVDISVDTPAGRTKVDKAKEAKEEKVSEAHEAKANDVEAKTNEVDVKAKEAETMAKVAEEMAKEAEAKAKVAEAMAKEAEVKEKEAEVEANKTEAKEEDHQEEAKQVETLNKPEEEAKDADEDWTVLDKSNASGASASPEPETLGAGAIYPKLDIPDLSGLNPKVQVALQAMENMGFTNEGGWLSNLLVKYDGDIGKVLDLLSPAQRS